MNNKYNNPYSRSSPGEVPMRFNNKRPRYGGGNNSPRFSQQNQSSYNNNYNPNRHNMPPSTSSGSNYKNKPYEQNPRNYYGHNSPKTSPAVHKSQQQQKPQQQQQNIKSSQFTQSSITNSPSASTSGPSSSMAVKTPNVTNLSTQPPTAQKLATMTQPNQSTNSKSTTQKSPVVNAHYSFPFNNYFFPNYTNDATTSAASTSAFGLTDTISPFMWQTITSTPPPNMLPQPPLPKQLPPTQKPPLPDSDMMPPLYPPPKPPSLGMNTPPLTDYRENPNDLTGSSGIEANKVSRPLVKIKTKRRAMSTRYNLSKTWTIADAEMALKAEEESTNKQHRDIILILRFPDPELSREIVKSYNPDIESVHFQLNFAPRYCFVHLKDGSNVDKAIADLSRTPFGRGYISAEKKQISFRAHATKPSEIDPQTLYVGNLPTTIACKVLKEHFPGSARIDIGFAQRMKYTRYAFVRYLKVEDAIEAYKRMLDAEISGRTIILRFRRIAATKEHKDDADNFELQEDELIPEELSLGNETTRHQHTQENSEQISQNKKDDQHARGTSEIEDDTKTQYNLNATVNSKIPDGMATNTATESHLESNKSNATPKISAVPTDSLKTVEDICKNNNNENKQTAEEGSNPNEANDDTHNNSLLSTTSSDIIQVNSESSIPRNIKPDPDDDPNDKVVENDILASRFDYNNVKLEVETDFECFPPSSNSQQCNKTTEDMLTNRSDISSIASDNDETIESGPSLGEFLKTCPTRVETETTNSGAPPAKKIKLLNDNIKKETEETDRINTNLPTSSMEQQPIMTTAIKEEMDDRCNIEEQEVRTECPTTKRRNNVIDNEVSSSKRQNANAPLNNDDDDDLVPPDVWNSYDQENSFNRSNEAEIYDEFFNEKLTSAHKNVKQEPSWEDCRTRVNNKDKNTAGSSTVRSKKTDKLPHSPIKPNNPTTSKDSTTKKDDRNKQLPTTTTTISTNDDDDDLVPEFYVRTDFENSEIKKEKIYDEFFALPRFKNTNEENSMNINNDSDSSRNINKNNTNNNNEDSVTSLNFVGRRINEVNEEPTVNRIPTKAAKKQMFNPEPPVAEEVDDDVIIISANFPSSTTNKPNTSTASLRSVSSVHSQSTKLVEDCRKPLDTTDKFIKSLYDPDRILKPLDYLDKLYEELNRGSDSDSDSDFEL